MAYGEAGVGGGVREYVSGAEPHPRCREPDLGASALCVAELLGNLISGSTARDSYIPTRWWLEHTHYYYSIGSLTPHSRYSILCPQ